MKSYELYEPTTVQQAVGMLNQFGATGKALGGGSDLIGGIMKDWVQGKGQPIPVQIVDLTTIPDLKGIKMGSDGAHIGATTTLSEVIENKDLQTQFPLLTTAAASTKMAWTKLKDRQVYDFAVVAVAAVFTVNGGNWADGRVTLGGVAPVPYRAQVVEDALKGKDIKTTIKAAAAQIRTVSRPM